MKDKDETANCKQRFEAIRCADGYIAFYYDHGEDYEKEITLQNNQNLV